LTAWSKQQRTSSLSSSSSRAVQFPGIFYQGTFQDLVPEEDLNLVLNFCESLEGNEKSEIHWGKLKTDFTSFFLFLFPSRFSPFRRGSAFGNLMEPATVQIGNVCCSKFPKNGTRPSTTVKNRKRSIKFPKIGTHPSMKFP
jgi:hypothetical protein